MEGTMPVRAKEAIDFVKQVANEFSDDDCMSMAASLAYYTVFSLAPMLVLVIVFAGLFVTPEQATEAVDTQMQSLIGDEGATQIATMVEHVRENPGGTWAARILGAVAVLLGSTGVMVQLQAALNRAWNVKPDPKAGGIRNFIFKRLLSFAMILALAFLLLVSLVLSAIFSAIADRATVLLPEGISSWVPNTVNFGVSFVVVGLLFAAIFKFMPEAKIQWRDVALGAAVTSLLFNVGKALIGLYLGNSNVATAYGGASSLAIVLIWVYYSAVIVMIGAEFTQVWTRRYGSGLEPQHGAVLADGRESTAELAGSTG
jgi:membrane protein